LQAVGVDLVTLFERLDAPVALADATGMLLWQNRASIAFFGDLQGRRFAGIPPEYRHQMQTSLARKSMGLDQVSRDGLVLAGADGERKRIETVSFSLMNGDRLVAILGVVNAIADGSSHAGQERLTPRLHETLRLLADGLSTDEIATTLGVARETARNYIRRLLRALGVHSRLEAVVRGRETGLI
jgi:DNA-binding CsgD family transcriptional regulator